MSEPFVVEVWGKPAGFVLKEGKAFRFHALGQPFEKLDGTEFNTRTCAGKAGDVMRLDIDPKSHPAWTGVQRMMDTGGQVAKFNKKFAGLGIRKTDTAD